MDVDWRLIDCAILDMDGTLLDLHFDNQVWNELLPRRYAEARGLDEATARHHVAASLGAKRGTLHWYCFDHWTAFFGMDMTDLEAELEPLIRPRPGALAFLAWLRARGLRLVLATNAHPRSLARKLRVTGIDRWFDDVVSAHTLGWPKEHDGFWPALERRCGFHPARTVLIDDNPAVLAAGRDSGIACTLGIARPDSRGGPVAANGFRCIERFTDLTAGSTAPPPQA